MTLNPRITAAIPLYNKEAEIAATLHSVLRQSYTPVELLIINDGSTDGSLKVVQNVLKEIGKPAFEIRIIDQSNSGVSVARNRALAEAAGDYVAFLDGDDTWEVNYLAEIARIIEKYPFCGAYSTAFDIVSNGKKYVNKMPKKEGVIEDFFRSAMSVFICQPSATVIPKKVVEHIGGFPEGMKIGEDLYMWIKIASAYSVCFSPERLVNYNRTASNRSVKSYKPENTAYSFEDFYRAEEGTSFRNEYIARCAIGKAITLSAKGDTEFGKRTERFFSYTTLYRRGWHKLRVLNRLPVFIRPAAHNFYNRMAWLIAKKGF